MQQKIKIVLIDDHQLIMDGIASLLFNVPEIEIAGKFSSSSDLFLFLEKMEIHIAMIDIFLPKPEGIEILKSIRKLHPKTKVIILSGNEEEELIAAAFNAGALAYITKNVEREELLHCISMVMNEQTYIGMHLEKKLSQKFIKNAIHGDKFAHHKIKDITTRELEIIKLLSDGLSYKEVGAQLNISTRTVETHKNNILEKLELKNMIELVKFAIKNKLTDL